LRALHHGPHLTGKRIGEARLQLLEQGFVSVRTPWFFDTGVLLRVRRRRTSLPANSQRWWKFPELARYGSWVEQLLQAALPEEQLCLAELEFRHEPAGSVDLDVDQWHVDGSYIRSVYTLCGPPTIYRDGGTDVPVPEGHTLLMTAFDRSRRLRIPATLHRRPGAGPERTVIVCSFEPCTEQLQQAPIYRRAAQLASS
jgi:hypothetical protein